MRPTTSVPFSAMCTRRRTRSAAATLEYTSQCVGNLSRELHEFSSPNRLVTATGNRQPATTRGDDTRRRSPCPGETTRRRSGCHAVAPVLLCGDVLFCLDQAPGPPAQPAAPPRPCRTQHAAAPDGPAARSRPSQRCGAGKVAGLRCPAVSTARTPRIALSLDRSITALVPRPTSIAWVQLSSDVGRHTTS